MRSLAACLAYPTVQRRASASDEGSSPSLVRMGHRGKLRGSMPAPPPKTPTTSRRTATTVPSPIPGGSCAKWKQELSKGELSLATLSFRTRREPHTSAIFGKRTVGQRNDRCQNRATDAKVFGWAAQGFDTKINQLPYC